MNAPTRAQGALVVVNAVGSNSGGGRTWTMQVVRELQRHGPRGLRWHFLVAADAAAVLEPGRGEVRITPVAKRSPALRMLWEQGVVPWRFARRDGTVLVNAANFGSLVRAQRTVLYARNALHFDEFRIRGSGQRRVELETRLARASVRRSRLTITATDAMASAVETYTGRRPLTIHFGPGLATTRAATAEPDGRFCFAHRTLWGPHKRLRDVLLAVRELAATHEGRFLVRSACDPHSSFATPFEESEYERRLLEDPLIAAHLEFAAFAPEDGRELRGDAVIMPSTVESFCFPLAEAVALGVPVIASDSAFARELCGSGAIYAAPHDPLELAAGMRVLVDGHGPGPAPDDLRSRLSWRRHVDLLANACETVAWEDRAPDRDV